MLLLRQHIWRNLAVIQALKVEIVYYRLAFGSGCSLTPRKIISASSSAHEAAIRVKFNGVLEQVLWRY